MKKVFMVYSFLKKSNITMVMITLSYKYKNPLNRVWVFIKTCSRKLRGKTNVEIPLYKLYHNLFSRYGGIDK